jgi:hypothetical protein
MHWINKNQNKCIFGEKSLLKEIKKAVLQPPFLFRLESNLKESQSVGSSESASNLRGKIFNK